VKDDRRRTVKDKLASLMGSLEQELRNFLGAKLQLNPLLVLLFFFLHLLSLLLPYSFLPEARSTSPSYVSGYPPMRRVLVIVFLFVCFLLFFFSSSHTQILHIAADLRLLWVDRVRELGVGGDGGVEHIGIIDHGGLENHINENDRKASQHGLEEAVREEDGNKGARGEQIGVASVRTADNGNNSA